MKIIIVGNGKVGYAIASQLAGEHHDIVMVDDNAVALQRAENALDVMCIEGNGASIRVLKEAGAQSADLVIAVTNLDDTNLLCCFIAKKLGAGHTIARVRNPEYSQEIRLVQEDLGLSMVINPEFAAAADTDYAYGQMMKAAQAMAQAGLRLFTDGDFRQQVDEEFETQVKNRH